MKKLVVVVRLILAIVFITYGAVKLMGGQYYYGDWVIDKKTTDGTFLVWAFFGYSRVYAYFTGLIEFGSGILILFPQTAILGAAALFAATLNITVMDFCFNFPSVKYASLIFTIMAAFILWSERQRLKLVFWDKWRVEAVMTKLKEDPELATAAPVPRMSKRNKLIATAVLIPIGFFYLNAMGAAVTPGPEAGAVDEAVAQGWTRDSLEVRKSIYTNTAGFNRHGSVWIQVKGSNPSKVLRIDVSRPISFVGWRYSGITEVSAQDLNSSSSGA